MFGKTQLVIFLVIASLAASEAAAAGGCKKLEDLEYHLFGTKTNYDTARRALKKINEDDLPKSFEDDSLEEEHKDLLEDHCKPVMFYFVGRHAARFPDAEEIEHWNKELHELQHTLETKSTLKECESVKAFLEWHSKMEPKHDNLLTELGAKQERELAKRFKKLYPEFFDAEKSDMKIGVTSKLRTAETAAEFLKEVKGLEIPNCEEGSIPTHDLEDPAYSTDKIHENRCYKTLHDRHTLPILEFHKQCKKISGEEHEKDELVEKAKDAHLMREIADHIARKLGLEEGEASPITPELVKVIYDECKFETAMGKKSVWCKLIDKKDAEILEFMKDVDIYISGAHGPHAKNRQACPVIKDLVESLHEGTHLSLEDKRKAFFYFTHAGVLKKLIAAMGLFKDDSDYKEKKIEEFIKSKKIDSKRDWQTSIVSPFGANMAFILYRCEEKGEVKHKILSTVTEQPVEFTKCKDTDCDSHKFFEHYDGFKHCDLEEICKAH